MSSQENESPILPNTPSSGTDRVVAETPISPSSTNVGFMSGLTNRSSSLAHVGTPRSPGYPFVAGTPFSQRQSTPGSVGAGHIRGDIGRGGLLHAAGVYGGGNHLFGLHNQQGAHRHTPSTPDTPRSEFGMGPVPLSPELDMTGEGMALEGGEGEGFMHQRIAPQETAVIWATDVNVQNYMDIFRDFIGNFKLGDAFDSFYIREMELMHRTQTMVLNLDCAHLLKYPPTKTKVYQQLISHPQDIIPLLDMTILDMYLRLHERDITDGNYPSNIQVRPFNLLNSKRMRDLDPENIDQLISIKGLIIRCSPVIPELKIGFFRCAACAHSVDVMIERGVIEEPSACANCKATGAMELIHNRCSFADKQLIRLQENPDEIPEGETPFSVSLFTYDALVDSVRPGDRVEITGIYKAIPRRTNPRVRTVKSLFKTFVDVMHIRAIQSSSSGGDDDSVSEFPPTNSIFSPTSASPIAHEAADGHSAASAVPQFTTARIKQFHSFANAGNCYERLIAAFAPSIWQMDDVKRGILCQLFGGTTLSGLEKAKKAKQKERKRLRRNDENVSNKRGGGSVPMALFGEIGDDGDDDETYREKGSDEENEDEDSEDYRGRGVHQRGDINILLCGDPGTSKSQLLSYVHKITPRGIYTSGKGSSAVGLTASVIRDPESKDMVLESGALVLSDNGVCCIDEFDKMSESTRAILHEAMEQQTVSITKSGIIATLNARTSILASANPVDSRYNANLSVVANIKLPPTLLSRFDLIYLILDQPNTDTDRRLARHLISLYYPEEDKLEDNSNKMTNGVTVDQKFLKDYIQYARSTAAPEITSEATELLVQGYLSMREMSGQSGPSVTKTITATPRQLESLIRLAQALSKMRLSPVVSSSDIQEALRLMQVATQTAATDPRTGTIDMDMISTGRSSMDRELIVKLAQECQAFCKQKQGQRVPVNVLRQALQHNQDFPVSIQELEEALREVEADGSVQIQYLAKTQMIIIR